MIPPKHRKEWQQLLTHDNGFQFSCFPLQMKISRLKRDLLDKKITIDAAVDAIRLSCEKYSRAVENDLNTIFGKH